MSDLIKVRCAWHEKPTANETNVSHGICKACLKKYFPNHTEGRDSKEVEELAMGEMG